METQWAKVSDNGHRIVVDLKRKQAAKCAAQIIGASHKMLGRRSKSHSSYSKLGKRKRLNGCKSDHGSRRRSLPTTYSNFMKSGLPQRVLFFENKEWIDFPADILKLVRDDFELKKAAMEVEFNGQTLMLDFLFMIQLDLKTGSQRPIAWIDEAGSCFFPETYSGDSERKDCCESFCKKSSKGAFLEANGTHEIKLQLEIDISGLNNSKLEECVEESNTRVKRIRIGKNSLEAAVANDNCRQESGANLEEAFGETDPIDENLNTRKFQISQPPIILNTVRSMFVTGMGSAESANIIEIKHCSGNLLQFRHELFKKQIQVHEKYHGNPNVKLAWLASSKNALSSIYGLGNGGLRIKSNFGIGVHLSPLNCAHTSASYCDDDENGIRYMLLCRVILGNPELVQSGSNQFHPSSEEFDSGVDHLQNPSHYVVWSMNMNTHIYPEYIVSFKMSSQGTGVGKESGGSSGTTTCKEGQGQALLDASRNELERNGHPPVEKVSNGKTTSADSTTSKAPPNSPWMPFVLLFEEISNEVSPKAMSLVHFHYDEFRAKKITRPEFINKLRMIIGDRLLRSAIITLQSKNLPCIVKPAKQEQE